MTIRLSTVDVDGDMIACKSPRTNQVFKLGDWFDSKPNRRSKYSPVIPIGVRTYTTASGTSWQVDLKHSNGRTRTAKLESFLDCYDIENPNPIAEASSIQSAPVPTLGEEDTKDDTNSGHVDCTAHTDAPVEMPIVEPGQGQVHQTAVVWTHIVTAGKDAGKRCRKLAPAGKCQRRGNGWHTMIEGASKPCLNYDRFLCPIEASPP